MTMISLVSMTCYWQPDRNDIWPVMSVKFGWNTQAERDYYKYVVRDVSLGCHLLGILLGTFLMKYSRRNAVITGLSLVIIGTLFHMILNLIVFVIGVGIVGTANGILIISYMRYI